MHDATIKIFWDIIKLKLGVAEASWNARPLKMRPRGCAETSGNNKYLR